MDIVCIGDSIVKGHHGDQDEGIGWAGRLHKEIFGRHCLHNLGINGDTIIDVYHRFLGEALRRQPKLLIIGCGANDIKEHLQGSGCALSKAQRLTYWEGLLESAKKNVEEVVVLSILPVIEQRLKFHRSNETIVEHNLEIAKLCKKYGAYYVDLHSAFAKEDIAELLHDGVHPNSAGYAWMAKRIQSALEEAQLLQKSG